jgi:hypothetical protein
MRWDLDDRIGLIYTPLVFAGVFALGTWADPVDLFQLHTAWLTRGAFIVAAVAMVAAAIRPNEHTRFVAMVAGLTATLSRGLTILVIGQPPLPRKAEIIGGSVWMASGWLVFAVWVLTVPSLHRWGRRRDAN